MLNEKKASITNRPANNVQCCLVRFQTIYHTLEDTLSATDAEEDLKWFRSNQGPGMPMNWPQFEVIWDLRMMLIDGVETEKVHESQTHKQMHVSL